MHATFPLSLARIWLAVLVALAMGGCAAQRPRTAPATTAPSAASTLPATERSKAFLALEDIEPRVDIAKLEPSSRRQERELIPALKRAGATGIITYPLNKVIP